MSSERQASRKLGAKQQSIDASTAIGSRPSSENIDQSNQNKISASPTR
jgi:hypothetical protein